MTLAGFLSAFLLTRVSGARGAAVSASIFRNPFALWPALKFGIVFTAVLFLARAANHYLGNSGQMAVSGISGLVDVDAISLTLAGFVQSGSSTRAQRGNRNDAGGGRQCDLQVDHRAAQRPGALFTCA